MCAVSHVIRERPNWWEEMKNKAVTEKWKKEILQQQKANGTTDPSRKVTTTMVKPRHPWITPPVLYLNP